MLEGIFAYVSAHSYDIIVGGALIALAVWLEWLTMGRFWRAFFKRR